MEILLPEGAPLFGRDYGYLQYLQESVQATIPGRCEPPPEYLLTELSEYLRQCLDNPPPMPPHIIDGLLDYCIGQAVEVEGMPPFSELAQRFRREFLPLLEPLDFEPLSPVGVEMAIRMLSAGDLKSVLDDLLNLFKILAEVLKKAKEFEVPEGLDTSRKEWRRNGPLQILALGQLDFFKNMPLSDVNNNGTSQVTTIEHTVRVPTNTVAITMELGGTLVFLTDQPLKFDHGASSLTLVTVDHVGPIYVGLWAEYSFLKSQDAKLSAAFANHFGKDGAADQYLTYWAKAQIKYYTLA